MGKSSPEFVEFIREQLTPIGELMTKRFFGGIALTTHGIQFGMLMDNTVYFVVNDVTRPTYEKMGCNCFSYLTKKGLVKVNRYFEIPAQALEEPALFLSLAIESITIADQTRFRKK